MRYQRSVVRLGIIAAAIGLAGCSRAVAPLVSPGAPAMVFLTHSHRDHVAAWPLLRHARFHVAAAEHSRLVGDSAHRGWVPQLGDRLKPVALPRAGELDVRTFSQDTTFVLGADTLRAYVVAGHTAGTTVYLFRGILFLGDAVTWSRRRGFGPAKPRVSDDPRTAEENLARLWSRLPPGGVRYVCTAHAHCSPFSNRFLLDVAQ